MKLTLVWISTLAGIISMAAQAQPTDPSVWDISGAGDSTIQGFATQISVNLGQTVHFKINTDATAYHLDIYRLGYYGGSGASLIAGNVKPTANLPQTQPACLTDATTGLVDCGNWAESASWTVPATQKSGIFFAKVIRDANPSSASHIYFVVRNDGSFSDIIFQTSDTTWQAYNEYGGNSLYTGGPGTTPNRAYKVSYNRPFTTRSTSPEDFLFNAEYPMIRFLEANGYDVTYTTGADVDSNGALLKNHKLYLSVGHDEYWSAAQRANVQAARDAGVNLAFFSGNEMFWKTRWENAISTDATTHRTLVCYKETHNSAVIDPADPPIWTGTWRDPRFSPPADGGQPENALSGTIFMVNSGGSGLAITVPAEDGKMRFWRNTSIANLAAGTSATLTAGTLQYEWDEDLDNGFRPSGLMHLSTTSASNVVVLADYGHTFTSGSATHNTTLYRAASGAWVFAAGTVQWVWGLDSTHDRAALGGAADSRMQQGVVNLFADMGVQPTTLQTGLLPATKSTDLTKPTSVITSPANGGTVPIYTSVTVNGTASDNGGAVALVEVSIDGGATWHPATGRASWSFTFNSGAAGSNITVQSRATDDSGNVQSVPASVTVTVNGYAPCPCSIWSPSATPSVPSETDSGALELGVKFQSDLTGYVSGIRFYKGSTNTGIHTGHLWSGSGALLGSVTFSNETASGWQQANFTTPIAIAAGSTYVVSYYAPAGHYSTDGAYFSQAGANSGMLHALANGVSGPNGVYLYGSSAFPNQSFNATNYWVDLVFTTPPPNSPPLMVGVTVNPSPTSATISWVTDTASTTRVDYGTSPTALNLSVSSATPVTTHSVTLTGLVSGVTYYYRVTSTNANGSSSVPPTGSTAASFTTPKFSIWFPSATPARIDDNDTGAVEVGMKFRSDTAGYITGVRFYKSPANTGTHVGHLWTRSGALLATATFTNETASGWQEASFPAAVAIAANKTYVVSYYAPAGHYSLTDAGFSTAGADNPPLHALANGVDGPNGLYIYGPSAFPTSSYNSTNYWVDVTYNTFGPPAGPAPVISDVGVTATPISATVTWTTDTAADSQVDYGTSASALNLSVNNISQTTAHSLTLPGLDRGVTYYYRVTSANTNGTPSWPAVGNAPDSFTTPVNQVCPCAIWDPSATPPVIDGRDPNAIELGVKFRSDVSGYVTGVRFYKAAANTGTHLGHLWTSTGTLLAEVTFTNESASGWQQANFAMPIAISAATTYVISYYAPAGHYSLTDAAFSTSGSDNPPLHALANGVDGPNGLYLYGASAFPTQSYNAANYWVDLVMATTPPLGYAPPVISTVAVSSSLNAATITWTSDVQSNSRVDYGTSPSTLNLSVTSPTLVTAHSLALTGLTAGTTYYYRVTSNDFAGSTTSPVSGNSPASFITPASQACPCSVWPSTAAPVTVDDNDPAAVELGMKFRSDVAGNVTAIRFYKAPTNTGIHTGHLWTSTGTLLATVTFTNESASGWQQASLSSPVAISANTTYVVSYYAPAGHYSGDGSGFTAAVDNPPLHALADGADGPNGLYLYGPGGFPTASFAASNYWVDIVFQ
jgi:hypothetical protein